ncbi:MAG: pyridoxamine 5'-phosphate oxidase family protein [Pseudorhodobacter sp.]
MTDPEHLGAFLDEAWMRLARGVTNRRSPSRHPTFVTVSPEGWPEARTVVLRGADRGAARLEVHTDLATAKVAALRANPRAALHIWEPRADLQIRAALRVEIVPQAEGRWDRIPEASRAAYGTIPAPGTEIASAFDYEKPVDSVRFAALICTVEMFDLVHLGPRHRRARFAAADGWQGQWLAP